MNIKPLERDSARAQAQRSCVEAGHRRGLRHSRERLDLAPQRGGGAQSSPANAINASKSDAVRELAVRGQACALGWAGIRRGPDRRHHCPHPVPAQHRRDGPH